MVNRRDLLKYFTASAGLAALPTFVKSMPAVHKDKNFIYCLNTATIREHHLGLTGELEAASAGGFDAVEIWMDTLQTFIDKGGKLADIRKRLNDLNLKVENAIGFAAWIADDETERNKAVEQLKKEMDQLAEIGCKRTAAPPAGATDKPGLDLRKAAERYRTILELGDKTGVIPHLELWGFSANLNKLSDVMFVAIESGHPKAKVLLDNYHLYKGGTSLESLKLINPSSTEVLHVNDYPGNLSREVITDADRTYPGDGVSAIREVLHTLKSPARPLVLSLEVFNKNYYRQKAAEVIKNGFGKMKKITEDVAKMDR
ncbi:MAG TPA: sugar phosphate isomerase/epimerase family protein [Flavitalea sp.]|nr:sugar phosphate isomerase/epimerase family protein [Flavitalea sp.]